MQWPCWATKYEREASPTGEMLRACAKAAAASRWSQSSNSSRALGAARRSALQMDLQAVERQIERACQPVVAQRI
jgi:hypothetical protein